MLRIPNHCLKLNWCPKNAFKNIDQANGLCNGTRLQVKELGKNVIGGIMITGKNIGHKIFIPRRTDYFIFRIAFQVSKKIIPSILLLCNYYK